MATYRGKASLSFLDTSDSKQLMSIISSNTQRQVIYDPNTGVYLPNLTNTPAVLTPELYVAGNGENIAEQASATRWYYQNNSSGSKVEIVGSTDTFVLSETKPITLTIKKNIFEAYKSLNITVQMDYIDPSNAMPITTQAVFEMVCLSNGTNGIVGENANTMILSNESAVISTASDGTGGSYTSANTKVTIYNGNREDTSDWTVTAVATGLTGKWNDTTKTYQVSDMSADNASVTFTAKQSGKGDLVKTFTLAKAKEGVGKDAVSTWMVVDSNLLIQDTDGNFDRPSVRFSGKTQVGTNPVTTYAGRFKIYETVDGTTWSLKYTSTLNESLKDFAFSDNIKAIKSEFYESGGTTNLIDTQQVQVLIQPKDGSDAQLLTLSSSADVMKFGSDDIVEAGQTITITAKLQNLTGDAVFTATPYIGEVAQAVITLGGAGNVKTLAGEQWDKSWTSVKVSATIGGQTDIQTIVKLKEATSSYVHNAYAWSADGTDRFTTKYPKENLFKMDMIYYKNYIMGNEFVTETSDSFGWASLLVTNEQLKEMLKPSTTYSVQYIFELLSRADNTIPYPQPQHGTFLLYSGVSGYPSVDLNNPANNWEDAKTWVVGTKRERKATFTTPSALYDSAANYRIIFYTMRSLNPDGSFSAVEKGKFYNIKFEESDINTIYTPSPSDDFENSYPTYSGTYTDYTAQDSQNPADYTWRRIIGENGKTPYLHKAYSWSADGSDGFTISYPNENILSTSYDYSKGWVFNNLEKRTILEPDNTPTKIIKLDYNPDGWVGFYQVSSYFKLLPVIGDTVTLSFYAKGNGRLYSTIEGVGGAINQEVTEDWRLYTLSGITTKDTGNISIYLHNATTTGTSIYIHSVKFEKGTATIYTPAPSEDYRGAYPAFEGAYTDYLEKGSVNYSDYTWARLLGSAGEDAIVGYLTNESVTLSANHEGVVDDFTKAAGTFKIFDGLIDKTGTDVTYQKVSETGCTGAISNAGVYSVTGMTTDTAQLVVRAIYKEVTIDKTLSLSKSKSGMDGTNGVDAYSAVLSNDNVTIPTDPQGNNGVFTGAISKISIFKGITDDTANWKITVNQLSGITGTLTGAQYVVTAMTVDSGYVDFVATKGTQTLTKRFTLAKNKKATDGQDSVSYWMVVDSTVIRKDGLGVLAPKQIVLSAMRQVGSNAITGASGYFEVLESVDGTTFVSKYTSTMSESTKTYVISSNEVKAIKTKLFFDGTRKVLIDEQLVAVIEDGDNPLYLNLNLPDGNTTKNSEGSLEVVPELKHGSVEVAADSSKWYRAKEGVVDSEAGSGWELLGSSGIRNFVPDTTSFTTWKSWIDRAPITLGSYDGKPTIRFDIVTGGTQQGIFSKVFPVELERGKKYVLNFKARGTMSLLPYFINKSGANTSFPVTTADKFSETEFREFSLSVTPSTSLDAPHHLALLTYSAQASVGTWMEFLGNSIILTELTPAPYWVPAPEDKGVALGNENLIKDGAHELVGTTQFMNYGKWDISPIGREYINEQNPELDFTLSFDLKTSVAGAVAVYLQSGSGQEYTFVPTQAYISATTEYKRYVVTSKLKKQVNTNYVSSLLAFYGIPTGVHPSAKNIKFELGKKTSPQPFIPHQTESANIVIQDKSIIVPAKAIDNFMNVRNLSEYNGVKLTSTVSLVDITDPIQGQIIGNQYFKNGQGTNEYIMRLYQNGIEIDVDGTGGTYEWTLWDRSGNQIPNWARAGKKIVINATDYDSMADIDCVYTPN